MSSLIQFYYPVSTFDRFFDDAFNPRSRSTCSGEACERPTSQPVLSFHPRLDVHESKEANIVTATFELPGLKPEDVTIEIRHDRLTVSSASVTPGSEGGQTTRERQYRKFARTLQLSFGTKAEDVKAKMENGLLSITFPKTNPEQQSQRIAIE